jgi:hypothetical protein
MNPVVAARSLSQRASVSTILSRACFETPACGGLLSMRKVLGASAIPFMLRSERSERLEA